MGTLAFPAAAASAGSCSYNAGSRTVTVEALPNEQATLAVMGTGITFQGASCSGATVLNTDTIVVTDPSAVDGEAGNLSVSRPEAFAPGDTPEPGSSDEIEWMVDLGPGRDGIIYFPGPGPHTYALGSLGVNFNAGETDGIDVDMTVANTDFLHFFLNAEYGGDSSDVIRGDGVAGTGGVPYPSHFGASAGPGNDLLIGGSGTNTFFPSAGSDAVDGGENRDEVFDAGDDASDIITGGGGNDTLEGGVGADMVVAGPGDDTIFGGEGDDRLDGQGGRDSMWGDQGQDVVVGGPGADRTLRGGAHDDMIRGKAGKDTLRGQSGNDRHHGGPQHDECKGGAGADTFASCEEQEQ